MRVGFDISQAAHGGGVSVYTKNLSKELEKNSALKMVYFYSSLRRPYLGDLRNVKQFRIPPTLLEPWFNKVHKIEIERLIGELDIFHSSDWTQPPTKAKKITTYHDVVPLKYPQWSVSKVINVHKRRLKWVEKEIDQVIAVSNATKQDLISLSKIPADKITVVYSGVDQKVFCKQDEKDIEQFRKKYNLPEKFILAIGGVGVRRNLDRVKEAAGDILVVTSGISIPFLPEKEMPILYASSQMLVYPSLYEGFGFPILEAMACGVPVITSNISAMPEVGGDAALYVDPMNANDISEKIQELLSDQNLRKDLISKGFKQADKFSWEETAKQTAQIYHQVLK